jgi:hypothetical protein
VIGLKLKLATRKIQRRFCRVGRIRRVRSRRVGRVIAQSPKADGRLRRYGFRVTLTVGRR